MYYFNKIVGWCLSPFGIFFLALALAGVLKRLRAIRLSRVVFWTALALLWLLGTGFMTRILGGVLEDESTRLDESRLQDLGSIDAIVLLGGSMQPHEKCGAAEMWSSADRVWLASRLWKKLSRPDLPIVLNGGCGAAEQAFLLDAGIPKTALRVYGKARNTEEEAQSVMAGLRTAAKPRPRILLVTSAWHMPRAGMLFARAGLDVIPAPTDFEMSACAEESVKMRDFFPAADAMTRNSAALKEWIAYVGYMFLRK